MDAGGSWGSSRGQDRGGCLTTGRPFSWNSARAFVLWHRLNFKSRAPKLSQARRSSNPFWIPIRSPRALLPVQRNWTGQGRAGQGIAAHNNDTPLTIWVRDDESLGARSWSSSLNGTLPGPTASVATPPCVAVGAVAEASAPAQAAPSSRGRSRLNGTVGSKTHSVAFLACQMVRDISRLYMRMGLGMGQLIYLTELDTSSKIHMYVYRD